MAPEGNDVKMNNQNPDTDQDYEAKGYSLSGKIMLSSIILLFFVVVLMFCLHIYARWYLKRARRRQLRRQRELRRSQLVFHNDAVTPTAISRGLDAAVLATLPVFTFDSNSDMEKATPECAVCLSEFEPGETGRILPKCNHTFHTECIDMWFHSHATCPLCRAPVEPASQPEAIVITVPEPESSSSASDLDTVEVENPTGSSSSVGSSKPKPSLIPVTIEVPPRGENFQHEPGYDSPSTQSSTSFRSPMTRMLSFTRMLGRERKGNVSPSSSGGECGAERGEEIQ